MSYEAIGIQIHTTKHGHKSARICTFIFEHLITQNDFFTEGGKMTYPHLIKKIEFGV